MLSASMLGATGPTLHDTARVRANFKCTSAICFGVGLIDSEMPSIGKMHDWFVAVQKGLNAAGTKLFPAGSRTSPGWVRIAEDGFIGAGTVAAARKILPLLASLKGTAFTAPTSKEQLALWIRGLSFPTGGMFLHHQIRDFAASLSPLASVAAFATAPAPIKTAPSPIATKPPAMQFAPAPIQSAPAAIPSGPTASLRPQGDAISVAAIPAAASSDTAFITASFPGDVAKKTDPVTKGLFIVGGVLVLGLAGIALLGKKA